MIYDPCARPQSTPWSRLINDNADFSLNVSNMKQAKDGFSGRCSGCFYPSEHTNLLTFQRKYLVKKTAALRPEPSPEVLPLDPSSPNRPSVVDARKTKLSFSSPIPLRSTSVIVKVLVCRHYFCNCLVSHGMILSFTKRTILKCIALPSNRQ